MLSYLLTSTIHPQRSNTGRKQFSFYICDIHIQIEEFSIITVEKLRMSEVEIKQLSPLSLLMKKCKKKKKTKNPTTSTKFTVHTLWQTRD